MRIRSSGSFDKCCSFFFCSSCCPPWQVENEQLEGSYVFLYSIKKDVEEAVIVSTHFFITALKRLSHLPPQLLKGQKLISSTISVARPKQLKEQSCECAQKEVPQFLLGKEFT